MNKDFETYYLAKTWKRILARIIDIIIVSLIPAIVTLVLFLIDKTIINSWKILLIMIVINYFILFLYFIIIPWKFSGQTLGKKIFLIKLVEENNQKIKLKVILLRETILVFIPLSLTMFVILLTSILLSTNIKNIDNETKVGFWITILIRTIYSFVFAWYLGIMITTKIDKKHQLFYDRKFQIYVINKKPLNKKINPFKKTENNVSVHIHLGIKQPGNIEQDELDEIQKL